MSVLRHVGRRQLIASFVAVAALTGSCGGAVPAAQNESSVDALLAQYEQPGTLTGGCEWGKVAVKQVRDVRGQLTWADEHSPARFWPHEDTPLPEAARNGAAMAFPRDNPQLKQQIYTLAGDVLLTGSLVTGELRCSGNSAYNPGADRSFSATFLVDELRAAASK